MPRASAFADTGVLESRLTGARATLLDNLDAIAAALAADSISVARVAGLDNLDALISSRAAAATALTTAINSIQYGTITLNGVATGTATITAVVVAKTAVHFLGHEGTAQTELRANIRVTLTNTTTLTATKSDALEISTVGFVVVEYK